MSMRDEGYLSKSERVEAMHRLRGIDDELLGFVRALSPDSGMAAITAAQFNVQVDTLIKRLSWLRITKG